MTAEKKIESLIYDLEKDIEACEILEKEYADKDEVNGLLITVSKLQVYREILNKIKP